VLGSFTDPAGHEYKMERDKVGALVSITTPSGKWLHFENDAQHRIHRIQSSLGRTMTYEYDPGGHLVRTVDSDGYVDTYTYDERSQMLTAAHENGAPAVTNMYSSDGYIKYQKLMDGGRVQFNYFRGPQNIIQESHLTDPNGMLTSFFFGRGVYLQTLPELGERDN
jgi:YD repeat-containing protein